MLDCDVGELVSGATVPAPGVKEVSRDIYFLIFYDCSNLILVKNVNNLTNRLLFIFLFFFHLVNTFIKLV
jgi:hypothetical protein